METLSSMLADPETKAPVALASDSDLAKLRAAIAGSRVRRRNGASIDPSSIHEIEGAYLRADRKVAYLIESGIPNFVIEERLEFDSEGL